MKEQIDLQINVKDNTIDSKCSNCGDCCTEFIPLTKHEYKQIKNYLKTHPEIKNEKHITPKGMHVLCPFRDREKKICKIYPVRPKVCRDFICNLSKKELHDNKLKHLTRAHYNNFNTNSIASLHMLFFDDYDWELQVLYQMVEAKNKDDFIRKLIKLNPVIVRENKVKFK